MTNKKERKSGHIDPGRPVSSLSREELAHLSSCQFCREQIALQAEKQELLTAPARMKSEILSKLNRPEVQIIAKSNRISKKLELFISVSEWEPPFSVPWRCSPSPLPCPEQQNAP